MKSLRILLMLLMLVTTVVPVFATGTPGQTTRIFDIQYPEWPVSISSYGGKLLLSDSPETVPADGIMYQDTVSGMARVFMYHVNGTNEPKRIFTVLENKGDRPARVTVFKQASSGPGFNYLEVGKQAQADYINSKGLQVLELSPKEVQALDESMQGSVVAPNALVNGIYDIFADQPVTVKIIMMPLNEDLRNFLSRAKVLPTDQYRLRGTFEGKDRMVVSDRVYEGEDDGAVAVTLADNQLDKYAAGIDATDGSKTVNYGNYGIFYHLFLPGNKGKVDYFLKPLGGTYAGVIGVKYRHQPEYALATPSDQLCFGTYPEDSAYLGSFDSDQSLWLTFSPPGASNLPIRIVLQP